VGKKTEPEEDNIFKPAFSPRFQTGANTVEQVVELFRASASVRCCSGAAKMPVLRQRHDALALKFFL
jgi:hypothetical protein